MEPDFRKVSNAPEKVSNAPKKVSNDTKNKDWNKMKKQSTINRNDLLLCTGLLLAALCIWCAIFFVQRNGSRDGLMEIGRAHV